MTNDGSGESPNYQHRLMDKIRSMLAYWDTDLRCRFANQAYREWFGVDPQALIGTGLEKLLGPALFALNEPHIQGALRGEEQLFERTITLPDGTKRETLANYVPDLVDGVVKGFVVQVTDVTPLKVIQEALQAREAYLQNVLALSQEGIMMVDDEGRYVDVNDACCRMLGYAREEILGRTFEAFVMPSELARLRRARAELLAGGQSVQEWMLRRKDGSPLPAEVRARLLPDGRRVGFVLDISIHRRALAAERALAGELERQVVVRTAELEQRTEQVQLSESRLRGIFDSATEGIVTTDHAQTIVEANAAAARMFRCEIDDMLGAPLSRFVPARLRDVHAQHVRDFGQGRVASGPMGHREVSALRADGVEFPIEASISRAAVDHQTLYTVVLRDVSEQKAMIARLQAAHEELHKLVAAMDTVQESERKRIAREMHDELQQTLAAIRLNAAAIGEASRRALADGDRRLLSEIEALAGGAIESTRRIVSDLRPRLLEDLGLVSALDAMASAFGQRHGVTCHFDAASAVDLDPQHHPEITTCLFRVAQEALNNVARHARASRVDLSLERIGDDRIALRVRDDGVGIGAADRRKRGSFGLMGIGERVRAVGGSFDVGPGPRGGTCLEVIVPIAAEATAGPGTAACPPS
jgi:PAS domain S-box-containing protein